MSTGPPPIVLTGPDNYELAYNIDFALIGILVALTVIYLPRTLARYAHKTGWTEGWMLLRGEQGSQYPRARPAHKSEASIRDKDAISPSTTHHYPPDRSNPTGLSGALSSTTHVPPDRSNPAGLSGALSSTTHVGGAPTIEARLIASKAQNSGKPPFHVPSYRSFVPVIDKVLDYHIVGYTIRQIAILAAYLAITCFGVFYQSDPRTNTNRAGFIVMSQMPIVFALGTKNSVITALTGVSYEQLNFLHRWVGQLMFLASLFHFVGKLVAFTKANVVAIVVKQHTWGVVAFSALCLLAVGSHPWFRARVYILFFYSHIIGLVTFIIGMWKHQPEVAPPYVITCIVLYAVDQVMRLAKTRVRKAILTPVPELDSTHVYIPHLDKGWAAGQHVRIRVLSFGVGILGWAESHPFTISNASGDRPEGLILVCKRAGDWTSALYRMASQKSNSEEYRTAYVMIEGPYGGPGNTLFSSFSGVMLVLGGSGITFGTSVLEDMIAKKMSGAARAMCINFVWSVQHPSAADPYLSTFVEAVQRAAEIPDLRITVSIFYTRGADNAYGLRTRLPPNVQIRSGRPNLESELNGVLDGTRHLIETTQSRRAGVVVAGCGPSGLISSIYKAKASATTESQRAVGGLELHTETFGW